MMNGSYCDQRDIAMHGCHMAKGEPYPRHRALEHASSPILLGKLPRGRRKATFISTSKHRAWLEPEPRVGMLYRSNLGRHRRVRIGGPMSCAAGLENPGLSLLKLRFSSRARKPTASGNSAMWLQEFGHSG